VTALQKKSNVQLTEIANYYSKKLDNYGQTPGGVDWNGEESQMIRFEQLSRVITKTSGFSVNDLGCGYGAFYDYLLKHFGAVFYIGIDISPKMVQAAENRYRHVAEVNFFCADKPNQIADYGIASGIFNVRLSCPDMQWCTYIKNTLDEIDRTSRLGFSFNCLTSYSDAEKMKKYLYYADPREMFSFCKERYSRNVALLHDYGLYEFTILVRKVL